jgi:heat-inducible transcriptional repressor
LTLRQAVTRFSAVSSIANFRPAAERPRPTIAELSERSREIFRHIVEAYVESGEPVGSRTLSRRLGMSLSPATIRNVMSDLEEAGLLYAPHTSAGRLPTEHGLRLFVHGLLELGGLTQAERANIDGRCAAIGRSLPEVLEEATSMLSGLSRCAGLVVAPKADRPLKHIEFVPLGPGRALVVLVTEGGMVENRIIDVPVGLPASLAGRGLQLPGRPPASAGRSPRRAARILDELEQPARRARPADQPGDRGRAGDCGRAATRAAR